MTAPHTFQDIPRAFTAFAEWGAIVVFVLNNKHRFSEMITGLILAMGLLLQLGVQIVAGSLPRFLWVPGMITAVFVMVAVLFTCSRINVKTAVYQGARAFILAELAASLEWQLYHFIVVGTRYETIGIKLAYVVVIYSSLFLLTFILEKKLRNIGQGMIISTKEMASAVIIVILIFTFSNLSFLNSSTPFSGSGASDIFNIRTLIDFSGYLILVLYHVQLGDMFLRFERDSMETMLHSQLMQYKLSRESIDLVNRKYHDLKHQIGILRNEQDTNVRNKYLDELENEIRIYEAQYKTGNKILDTILTSQALYCMKHEIELNCVVDGKLLDFMDVMDICTIFGNALDNAVECELKVADKEKRMIMVRIFQQKQFVIIGVKNYCEEEVVMSEGLPLTTKNNHSYHGFGVKSIQVAAQKYGGNITVNNENNWFKLLVMIPL